MATPIKRQYTNLAGVDFRNEETLVDLNRSPDALNVYKDYEKEGSCIETRPGYRNLGRFDGKINGMHMYSSTKALVHAGTNLYLWPNFPSRPQLLPMNIQKFTKQNVRKYSCNEIGQVTITGSVVFNDSASYNEALTDHMALQAGTYKLKVVGTISSNTSLKYYADSVFSGTSITLDENQEAEIVLANDISSFYIKIIIGTGNHNDDFYITLAEGETATTERYTGDTPNPVIILKDTMNNEKSSSFIFDDKLYINDGTNYLVYNGTTLKNVSEEAYIPTTTIGRRPAGGGTMYQDVNLLQPKRINLFIADGTSTEYHLDTTNITSVDKVYVNDVLQTVTTDYTVNTTLGTVTFTTAPAAPDLSGTDNVKIEFSKTVSGYSERITNCPISRVFDNRVFFTGNINYKNVIFHSELNNPAYVSDLNYYEDGTSESAIKDITVGNNILWVFKEPNQENATVFYHIPMTSGEYGRIYPSKQGNVSTGCYSESINFNDDIVFLSKYGLEGISGNIQEEQLLTHRSSLVDNKLINVNNFNDAKMYEWKGYLLILVDKYIFLADSRQKFQGINGIEYEWYLWDIEGSNPTILKEYKGSLYIGSSEGDIYVFGGTNDNGEIINSYWTTPMDSFGYSNMMKTTNKRGGLARIKTIPNGKIKIAERTNRRDEKYITSKSATGFDYSNIDYSNFAYTTKIDSYIVYKIKEKKFLTISLKFYSDELDKPFGLYSAILEAFIGGYVKR